MSCSASCLVRIRVTKQLHAIARISVRLSVHVHAVLRHLPLCCYIFRDAFTDLLLLLRRTKGQQSSRNRNGQWVSWFIVIIAMDKQSESAINGMHEIIVPRVLFIEMQRYYTTKNGPYATTQTVFYSFLSMQSECDGRHVDIHVWVGIRGIPFIV